MVDNYALLYTNRPFYRYGSHIKFIRFKENYGMPRGALAQYLRARFEQKRTSRFISQEKGDYCYIRTQHNDLFFPLQSFSRKT